MYTAGPEKHDRMELLEKLAAIEERVMTAPTDDDRSRMLASYMNPASEALVIHTLRKIGAEDLFAVAGRNRMLLTPRVFSAILLTSKPDKSGVAGLGKVAGTVFRDLVAEGTPQDVLQDTSYVPVLGTPSQAVMKMAAPAARFLSTKQSDAVNRIVAQLAGKDVRMQVVKTAAEVTDQARFMAREYAKYQIQYLAQGASELELDMAVAAKSGARPV